jgi:hypothetical protein
MWYQTIAPDPVKTVNSVISGYCFHCPDLATIDQHIAGLLRRIGQGSNLAPARKKAARQDIDRLLERRLYLMLVDDLT